MTLHRNSFCCLYFYINGKPVSKSWHHSFLVVCLCTFIDTNTSMLTELIITNKLPPSYMFWLSITSNYFRMWYSMAIQAIFRIQKRIIRIITNKSKRDSCRQFFKQLQILTLPSQYIFSLFVFVAKHRDLFLSNSDTHNINTHYNDNLHLLLQI